MEAGATAAVEGEGVFGAIFAVVPGVTCAAATAAAGAFLRVSSATLTLSVTSVPGRRCPYFPASTNRPRSMSCRCTPTLCPSCRQRNPHAAPEAFTTRYSRHTPSLVTVTLDTCTLSGFGMPGWDRTARRTARAISSSETVRPKTEDCRQQHKGQHGGTFHTSSKSTQHLPPLRVTEGRAKYVR